MAFSLLRQMARPFAPTTIETTLHAPATPNAPALRTFSTSATMSKKAGGSPSAGGQPNKVNKTRRKNQAPKSEFYARVKILKQNMFAPAPPPLRMARLRYLRHWTIHRAWLLFRRQQRETGEKERARMQAGMYNACEELRNTAGPGDKDEGYLYRVAMERKGVWGKHAIPIEYARYQTDYAGAKPWNHEWTR